MAKLPAIWNNVTTKTPRLYTDATKTRANWLNVTTKAPRLYTAAAKARSNWLAKTIYVASYAYNTTGTYNSSVFTYDYIASQTNLDDNKIPAAWNSL